MAVRLAVPAVVAGHAGLDDAAPFGIAGREREERVTAVTGDLGGAEAPPYVRRSVGRVDADVGRDLEERRGRISISL